MNAARARAALPSRIGAAPGEPGDAAAAADAARNARNRVNAMREEVTRARDMTIAERRQLLDRLQARRDRDRDRDRDGAGTPGRDRSRDRRLEEEVREATRALRA